MIATQEQGLAKGGIQVVALDICNTLANIAKKLINEGLVKTDVYPSPLPEDFFISEDGLQIFLNAEPIRGALQMVRHLEALYGSVIYVTTRPKEAEFVTCRWLAKHGFPISDIHFCSWQDKPAVYESLNPRVIAEDDPRVLEMVKSMDTAILALQWPYNSHVSGGSIVQVDDWEVDKWPQALIMSNLT
ncbi:hypothetical protein ACOBQJ_03755 [Pelotomaculum propionicicum]|uniref:hypothetical protein n=1 Tax=Pelotomaculum propionicicum TaxID=258475 RepID=UPI003B7F3DDC